jgi:tetratricopeptide (TPR) repeat protein
MHSRATVPLLSILLTSSACQSTSIRAVVGDVARYSPEVRGYVVSLPNGSEHRVLFDPIHGRKVRCREDLEPWVRAWADALPQSTSNAAWENNSFGYMLPFTLAMLPAFVPYAGTRIPYWIAKSPSSDAAFERGIDDFRQARYEAAAARFEEAIVLADMDTMHWQYVFYYLGLSYEQIGKRRLAAEALQRFIERSAVFDSPRYDVAEERLLRLGGQPPPQCITQEPFAIPWKDGG